jgi:hypothetical protein
LLHPRFGYPCQVASPSRVPAVACVLAAMGLMGALACTTLAVGMLALL